MFSENWYEVLSPGASISSEPMMHIAYSPISTKFINFPPSSAKFINSPCFCLIDVFWLNLRYFLLPRIFAMMHLCIMQHTYWTPLPRSLCSQNLVCCFQDSHHSQWSVVGCREPHLVQGAASTSIRHGRIVTHQEEVLPASHSVFGLTQQQPCRGIATTH